MQGPGVIWCHTTLAIIFYPSKMAAENAVHVARCDKKPRYEGTDEWLLVVYRFRVSVCQVKENHLGF